jgi:hypothetical protein
MTFARRTLTRRYLRHAAAYACTNSSASCRLRAAQHDAGCAGTTRLTSALPFANMKCESFVFAPSAAPSSARVRSENSGYGIVCYAGRQPRVKERREGRVRRSGAEGGTRSPRSTTWPARQACPRCAHLEHPSDEGGVRERYARVSIFGTRNSTGPLSAARAATSTSSSFSLFSTSAGSASPSASGGAFVTGGSASARPPPPRPPPRPHSPPSPGCALSYGGGRIYARRERLLRRARRPRPRRGSPSRTRARQRPCLRGGLNGAARARRRRHQLRRRLCGAIWCCSGSERRADDRRAHAFASTSWFSPTTTSRRFTLIVHGRQFPVSQSRERF